MIGLPSQCRIYLHRAPSTCARALTAERLVRGAFAQDP